MRYFKQYKDSDERKEITYEEALDTLLTTYNDNEMTREMLTIPGEIQCMFSWINVEKEEDE